MAAVRRRRLADHAAVGDEAACFGKMVIRRLLGDDIGGWGGDEESSVAVISDLIADAYGESGSATLTIDTYEDDCSTHRGWAVSKVWAPGAKPVIRVLQRRPTKSGYDAVQTVVQTLALTPSNSSWAAGWLVDRMEENTIYKSDPHQYFGGICASLDVFDLPTTKMIYYGKGTFPAWVRGFQIETDGADKLRLAKIAHTHAQETAYQVERAARLRSMARTWAQVSAVAVTAALPREWS